jgi:hypothetical protein
VAKSGERKRVEMCPAALKQASKRAKEESKMKKHDTHLCLSFFRLSSIRVIPIALKAHRKRIKPESRMIEGSESLKVNER